MINFKEYYLLTTLLELDYPVIFVCSSKRNDFLLCVESESNNEFEEWVACYLDDKAYEDLIYGKASLQKCFKVHESSSYFKITHSFNDDTYISSTLSGYPDSVIDFSKETYYSCKEQAGQLFSKYFGEEKTFGFDFNPHTNKHELNAAFFGELVLSVKSYFNNAISKIRDNLLMVSLYPESFLMRFEYKGAELTDSSISLAIDNLYSILTSTDYKTAENNITKFENPKIVNPIKNIINCLSKSKTDFYMFYNANNKEKNYTKISTPNIKIINNSIKNLSSTSKPEDMTGILKAYDGVSRTFKFDVGQKIIKGKFSKDFKITEQLVIKKYLGHFNKIQFIDENNKEIKTAYELVELETV